MKIQTKRLILQKYEATDFEVFCDVICNDEVMLHIPGKGNTLVVAHEKFDSILKTNQESDNYGLFKVILLETNQIIGFAKITPYKKGAFEIGYALLPEFWRKGFTIEMINKMVNHCVEKFPSKQIMAIVNETNVASLKVLEKCNFKIYKKEDFKGALCLFLEYLQ